MEEMLRKDWAVDMYTTDTWISAVEESALLKKVCEKKERWIDWKKATDDTSSANADNLRNGMERLNVNPLD